MKRALSILSLLSVVASFAGSVPHAWAVTADDATDICAAEIDPCVITQEYDIVDGSVLDFGTRAVEIAAGGSIDTNAGEATLLAGSISTDASTAIAFKVRGNNGLGQVDGGFITIEARRRCELDDQRTCTGDENCDFGACTAKVCENLPTRVCETDDTCNFGTCDLASNSCTMEDDRACTEDADCQLGPCSVTVCSLNRNVQCSANADCDFGTCSVGTGTILLQRPMRADGATPGNLIMRAAGDITIGADVTARSNTADSDGGVVEMDSGAGNVTIDAQILTTGGGFSTGGEIDVIAGQDIVVNATLNANGGDFDGGFVELDAGRDVIVNNVVAANSTNGGGFGGEIIVFTGRDITATSPATFEASGHHSLADNFGGDGGAIELAAGEDLSVGASVLLSANGAEPDGFGGEVLLESGGNMRLAGAAEARTSATAFQGAGGTVDIDSTGSLAFPPGALIDVRGAANGGGAVFALVGDGMAFGGTMDARAVNNGVGDGISLDVNGDVTMTGIMRVAGTSTGGLNGQISFEFCRLTMSNGALIDNVGGFGRNTLRARERVTIETGATMRANATNGTNRIMYRDPDKPPVINGTVTPPAEADDINEFLFGCPVCGNGEIDGGETCEDGNTDDGDGCSAECQDEQCVAQTPGFPDVPLCDDGDGCTRDECDMGNCQNIDSCDDNVDCTADACTAGECVHNPDNALCDDGNPCTDDVCSVLQHGCLNTPNVAPCDDTLACTTGDSCIGGLCTGTDTCPEGQSCSAETGECASGAMCGDGEVNGTDQCDDGDTEWTAGQACDAECNLVDCGDPDDSATVRASDALFVLRVAVGGATCDPCVCNVDNSTTGNPVSASDALRVLRRAVSSNIELTCPVCL